MQCDGLALPLGDSDAAVTRLFAAHVVLLGWRERTRDGGEGRDHQGMGATGGRAMFVTCCSPGRRNVAAARFARRRTVAVVAARGRGPGV